MSELRRDGWTIEDWEAWHLEQMAKLLDQCHNDDVTPSAIGSYTSSNPDYDPDELRTDKKED